MIFSTLQQAENYFWEKLAKHNEDEKGLEYWLENEVQILENEDLEMEQEKEKRSLEKLKYN